MPYAGTVRTARGAIEEPGTPVPRSPLPGRIKGRCPRDVSLRSACFAGRPGGHRQGQDVTVRVQQVTGALAPGPVPQAIQ